MLIVGKSLIIFLITALVLMSSDIAHFQNIANARPKISLQGPTLIDTSLKAQLIVQGLKAPTSMAFLGPEVIPVSKCHVVTRIHIVNSARPTSPIALLKE